MRPRHALLVIAGLAVILSLSSCDSDSGSDTVAVVGTWERNFVFGQQAASFHLTFGNDGVWLLRPAGQSQGFQGTYTIDGRRLTVQDPTCAEGDGRYDVRIVDGRLGFTLVEDPCFRSNIFQGSWAPVTAP